MSKLCRDPPLLEIFQGICHFKADCTSFCHIQIGFVYIKFVFDFSFSAVNCFVIIELL